MKYFARKMSGKIQGGGYKNIKSYGMIPNHLQIVVTDSDNVTLPSDWIIINEIPERMYCLYDLMWTRNGKKVIGTPDMAFPDRQVYGQVKFKLKRSKNVITQATVNYSDAQQELRTEAWKWWIPNIWAKDKLRMGLATQEEIDLINDEMDEKFDPDDIKDNIFKKYFEYDHIAPTMYEPKFKTVTYENSLLLDSDRKQYLQALNDPEALQAYLDSWHEKRPVK